MSVNLGTNLAALSTTTSTASSNLESEISNLPSDPSAGDVVKLQLVMGKYEIATQIQSSVVRSIVQSIEKVVDKLP
jgi:hypothetical protein